MIGVLGVAVAVWALIVVIAVFSGFIAEIRSHLRNAAADLTISAGNDRCSYSSIEAILDQDPGVAASSPRLKVYALLYPRGIHREAVVYLASTGSSPLRFPLVSLVGIDPEREANTTSFEGWLAAAPPRKRVDDPAKPFAVSSQLYRYGLQLERQSRDSSQDTFLNTGDGIVVSSGRRLNRGRGLDLVTMRPTTNAEGKADYSLVQRRCTVTGAYETDHSTFNEYHAFVDIEVTRDMLGESIYLPTSIDLVSEVAVRLEEGADVAAVQSRLSELVAPHGFERVQTWEQQNQVFLGAVNHERAMMKVVLFCVMLVAAFLIYATLHMMVTQKVRDIGVLTAMGATPAGIATIFVGCAAVIAGVGCGLGVAAGIGSTLILNDVNDWLRANVGVELFPTNLYDLQAIPYRLEWGWISQVVLAAFALAVLVALLPARRAARLDPARALTRD